MMTNMKEPSVESAPLPKRRRLRFSLRSLLVIVLAVSCLLGWVTNERRRIDEWRHEMLAANFEIGTTVRPPTWRTWLFGDKLPEYASVIRVFGHCDADALGRLQRLPRLETLTLVNANSPSEPYHRSLGYPN